MRVIAPLAPDEIWREYGLDGRTLERMPIKRLVELLVDMSPDVSKGLWDFLRLFNPGWKVKALKPGASEETIDTKAQKAIDTFLAQLHGVYAAPNVVPADTVINMLSIAAFLRGGMLAELVLDESGRIPLEIAAPDPVTVRFRRIADVQRGQVWQLGQQQGIFAGTNSVPGFTPLDRQTVVYAPVDPLPGKPHGRPMIHPAIFATLFLIGLLHDLRRVVAQQGYPRLDLVIDAEKMKKLMPANLLGDAQSIKEWFAATFEEIRSAYSKLQPDDAYVHFDMVTVNVPKGAATQANLGGVGDLIQSLERMLTKALKTMPLMMAAQGSGNLTNANRQWEIQAAGIKSIQHMSEFILERLLTLALRAQGIVARVEFRFGELRAAELLRDAQVEYLKIRNARMLFDNGSIGPDEMAERSGVKHKADQPQPRAALSGAGGQVASINAEPGSQRGRRGKRNAAATALLFTSGQPPTQAEIDDAVEWFNEEVEDAAGLLDAEPTE